MLDLSMVTSAIVAMGVESAWEKAKRQESVLKLLKLFKLDSENLPTEFDDIYTYTLIQYGADRPEPILNLFRNKFVREAFQESFYKNDLSILNKEAEGIIEWNEETGKLGRIEYDPRREFAAFSIVFNEIVDRTRTPAEVKRDRKLDDLHRGLSIIIERLDKLTTLNDVRSEVARITQNTALDGLAQQMRTWFEALDYRFEHHDIREQNYFEWIIKVPAWRRYDSVLIRGIEGEVGVSDIRSLRQGVDKYKTDKGCLVAARRISQAAYDEVKKKGYQDLSCCTFDELLDQDADFSSYFTWLEDEIKRRGIEQGYVPLACIKEEFDPFTKKKIAESNYDESNGWIEGYIDQWLDDPSKQHISILGEFGTGKTWFALHYAWNTLQKYKSAKARGTERGRLPLVIPLRDYAKALDVENVLARFFFHKHNLRLNSAVFDQLNRMGKLLLIFDGFDEMAAKVDNQKMIDNFWELARVVVPGAKAILTCRNEHFPEAERSRALLNAELKASTAMLTGRPPQFEVLKLKPFNEAQIHQVLSLQSNTKTVQRITSNKQLMDLARRPLMIELILEALPDVSSGKKIDMSRIYLYAMRRKMERDIKEERTFTSLIDKLYFMSELSWEMLLTNQMSLNYQLFPDKIRRLFGPVVQQQKDLDHWRYDMMGQTLLIRNDEGDYSPAHRSFLEFFVAYKFAAELGILASDFISLFQSDQNKISPMVTTAGEYTWSAYFARQLDETNTVKPLPYLRKFIAEDIDNLAETVGKNRLTLTIWKFLQNMIDTNREEVKARLLSIIQKTRGKSMEETGLVGSNIAAMLIHLDPSALRSCDLSGVNLQGLRLSFENTEAEPSVLSISN